LRLFAVAHFAISSVQCNALVRLAAEGFRFERDGFLIRRRILHERFSLSKIVLAGFFSIFLRRIPSFAHPFWMTLFRLVFWSADEW